MKHLDLFSGIGGFALAADRVAKFEHTFCEIDPFCQLVLKKHWPNSKIYGDIRTLTADTEHARRTRTEETGADSGLQSESTTRTKLPKPKLKGSSTIRTTETRWDLLTGGFPCQPFSQAGRRKGTEDDRHLWPEMLRVIREFSPLWVIGENVGGFVTWNDGLVLRQVFADLEGEGYEVQAFIIPAVSLNAPHRRDRIWIVGHSRSTGTRKQSKRVYRGEFEEKNKEWKDIWGRFNTADKNASNTKSKRWKRFGNEPKGNEQTLTEHNSDWRKPWTEVATKLCGVFNGLSEELDEIRLKKYAKISEKITRQNLPCLWEAFQSEKVQWDIGRFNTVQHKDYLFTVLWKLTQKSEAQNNLSFESEEVQKAFLRNVWPNGKTGCSPQGQKHKEQPPQEFTNALSQLSHEIALATEEIWKWYNKDRNSRLKALGNAIVPQVAEEIIRAIYETN